MKQGGLFIRIHPCILRLIQSVSVKQGGLFIRIQPCSLRLIQSPDRSITEGEESCVKTSKGGVVDHD